MVCATDVWETVAISSSARARKRREVAQACGAEPGEARVGGRRWAARGA